MSPLGSESQKRSTRFPRVSGDEPERRDLTLPEVEFSPRERG